MQKSRVYYNLGNNAYRQQKTDEALQYYKKALSANPRDIDAKYNIEFISAAKKNKDKQKDKDKQDEKNKKPGKDMTGKPDEKKSGMSKEDARRILQYYNESDKNAAKKRKMPVPAAGKTDEDW